MDSDSDKIEDEVDSYLSKSIILRNYQSVLLEEAKKRNSILFLPTGSGKTLIAVHVLSSRTEEIRRPYKDGGKRAFFMANTKVLVNQLAQVLRTHTKFKVGYFTGDMNVDSWNREKWISLFEKYQETFAINPFSSTGYQDLQAITVKYSACATCPDPGGSYRKCSGTLLEATLMQKAVIVLTGEILRQILQLNYITPSRISLIVVDECHHAVLDHPYRLVMKAALDVDPSESPLILGLSAVLLNSNPKKDQLLANILLLESTFKGKVLAQKLDEDVLQFSTCPTEKIMIYRTDKSQVQKFVTQLKSIIDLFGEMNLKPQNCPDIPLHGVDFRDRNKAKRIHKALVNCSKHFVDLGLYGGSLSALYFIIVLEKYRLLSDDQNEIQALIYARTELNKLRHILVKMMGEQETGDSIIKFSSDRVRQLIQIIKQVQEGQFKQAATLVFVHQRATAVVLAYLLKRLSVVDSKYNFIKANFIVGSSMIVKESLFLGGNGQSIIKEFTTGSLNVLVSTNLLEEGLDLPDCNVVVSFDFPLGYPSYFQSKGRARDKTSLYYVFIENEEADKKLKLLSEFKAIADDLNQFQNDRNDEKEEEKEEEEDTEKIFIQGPSGTLVVDGITAIKAVYRYCAKLPQDRYSLLSPTSWFVKTSGSKKKAFVQLPVNCPLRDVIEGKEKENKKMAKRSAFLSTLEKLYEMGEIDGDLNPKGYDVKEEELVDLFPHFRNENIDKNLPQPGTSKRKQIYKEKFAESLSTCLPRPGAKCYLHVIDFTVIFDKPELERKVAIYELLKIPVTFAIVSSRKLRKIFQFPVFLDIGRINCDLLVNYEEIILSESEINDIKICHIALFKKVMRILKNFQVFDNRNKGNSFFIAPVEKNETGRFVLNWDLIRCDFCKDNNLALVKYNPSMNTGMESVNSNRGKERDVDRLNRPKTEESSGSLVPADGIRRKVLQCDERPRFAMSESEYKYFVLVPNYRKQDPPQYYIVNKFCRDMSPLSPFPRVDFTDYLSYYMEKYEIEITNTKQPLLRVSALYSCSNFNKPRDRKPRRSREGFKEYDEHLVPELCDVIPFDKRFWIKALLVPTVLNRISHVYCVEEFRRNMFSELGLGSGDLPEGKEWRTLEMDGSINHEPDKTSNNSSVELKSALPLSQLKDKTQMNPEVVLDPERHLCEFGLCDLEVYIGKMSKKGIEISEEDYDEVIMKSLVVEVHVPPIRVLKIGEDGQGPDLAMLVEASTSTSANDIVNYERLEILGDSFLKFATTLYLFKMRTGNEGVLTSIKGKIIGNRNLLYCGLAKKIEDIVNVTDFSPLFDWNPPLLRIPETLVDDILANNTDTTVLYRFEIPSEEQFSGVLSEATLKKNKDILENYTRCLEMPTNSLLPCKVVRDKTVSDCVEALIGTHLSTLGVQGAFKCLLWLGVLPRTNELYAKLMEKPFKTSLIGPGGDVAVENNLSQVFYSELEDVLNYRFKSRALLLEALTHPSYTRNRITDCYQRLEFLGDAVLDFLITSYIYENCGSLTPGQVTDIRSALVNNITFACLVVRYRLHSYMLSFSSALNSAIESFVIYQKERNHAIDENVLILMEENDCLIAETIQVPKALGDLFESLAGAIFLDSGNSLETVWNVFYRLMSRELDEFTKTVPKTCVRLLYEVSAINGDKPFYETKVSGGVTKVCCTVYYMNEEIKAHGFGRNKKEAKRSAAKLVLNQILALKRDEESGEKRRKRKIQGMAESTRG